MDRGPTDGHQKRAREWLESGDARRLPVRRTSGHASLEHLEQVLHHPYAPGLGMGTARGHQLPWLRRNLAYAAPSAKTVLPRQHLQVQIFKTVALVVPAVLELARHKQTHEVTVFVATTMPHGPDQILLRSARVAVPLSRFAAVQELDQEMALGGRTEAGGRDPLVTVLLPLAEVTPDMNLMFQVFLGCASLHEAFTTLPPAVYGTLATRAGAYGMYDANSGALAAPPGRTASPREPSWTAVLPLATVLAAPQQQQQQRDHEALPFHRGDFFPSTTHTSTPPLDAVEPTKPSDRPHAGDAAVCSAAHVQQQAQPGAPGDLPGGSANPWSELTRAAKVPPDRQHIDYSAFAETIEDAHARMARSAPVREWRMPPELENHRALSNRAWPRDRLCHVHVARTGLPDTSSAGASALERAAAVEEVAEGGGATDGLDSPARVSPFSFLALATQFTAKLIDHTSEVKKTSPCSSLLRSRQLPTSDPPADMPPAITYRYTVESPVVNEEDCSRMLCPCCGLACCSSQGVMTHLLACHGRLVSCRRTTPGTLGPDGQERGALVSVVVRAVPKEDTHDDDEPFCYWRGAQKGHSVRTRMPDHLSCLPPAASTRPHSLPDGRVRKMERVHDPLFLPLRVNGMGCVERAKQAPRISADVLLACHAVRYGPSTASACALPRSVATLPGDALDVLGDSPIAEVSGDAAESGHAGGRRDCGQSNSDSDVNADWLARTARLLEGYSDDAAEDDFPAAYTCSQDQLSSGYTAGSVHSDRLYSVHHGGGLSSGAAGPSGRGRARGQQRAAGPDAFSNRAFLQASGRADRVYTNADGRRIIELTNERTLAERVRTRDQPRYFHHLTASPLISHDLMNVKDASGVPGRNIAPVSDLLTQRIIQSDLKDPILEAQREWASLRSARALPPLRQLRFEMLWNTHLLRLPIVCNAMVPAAVEHFCWCHSDTLQSPDLRPLVVAHLMLLWRRKLITSEHMAHCLMHLRPNPESYWMNPQNEHEYPSQTLDYAAEMAEPEAKPHTSLSSPIQPGSQASPDGTPQRMVGRPVDGEVGVDSLVLHL